MVNNSDEKKIEEIINVYITSINNNDLELAKGIWLTSHEASLIHPRGHERGWEEVVKNFYHGTMDFHFSRRDLRLAGPASVHVFGGMMAVAEFYWDFTATQRENGEVLTTSGRESQAYYKVPDLGWRLVQVHYSGPPVTGAGEGF